MSDLCFQASIGAYVMIGGLSVGAGAIGAAVLAVLFREWQMRRAASAIEARSDATTQIDAAEGESAGPKDDAQSSGSPTPILPKKERTR